MSVGRIGTVQYFDGGRNRLQRIIKTVWLFIMPIILAALLITYSIIRVWYYKDNITSKWYVLLSTIIMIICGILIIAFRKKHMTFVIGLYTIGIASMKFFTSINDFFVVDASWSLVLELFYFGKAVVFILLSGNLLVSSVSYLKGISRNRFSMTISAILLLIFDFFMVASSIIPNAVVEVTTDMVMDNAIHMVMYAVYIGILTSEDIRSYELMEHYISSVDTLRRSTICDSSSWIDSMTAEKLGRLEKDESIWTDMKGWGPVEYEYKFLVQTKRDRVYVIAQRWKDSDKIYLTISAHNSGSMISADRIAIDHIVYNEERSSVSFYNDDGDFLMCPVRDPREAIY